MDFKFQACFASGLDKEIITIEMYASLVNDLLFNAAMFAGLPEPDELFPMASLS